MKQDIVFNEKKHIWNGTVSCVMAAIEAMLFIVLIIASCMQKGNAGSWIGMVCVVILLMAAWGIYIGFKGVMKRKRIYKLGSWLGILLNGIACIGIVILFLYGL